MPPNPIAATQLQIVQGQLDHQRTIQAEQLAHQRRMWEAEEAIARRRLEAVTLEAEVAQIMRTRHVKEGEMIQRMALERAKAERDAARAHHEAMEQLKRNLKDHEKATALPPIPDVPKGGN